MAEPLNMRPRFSGHHMADKSLGNSIMGCQFRLAYFPHAINQSDIARLVLGKFRICMARTAHPGRKVERANVPSFRNAIAHVCGVAAEKKMNRAEARRIIAVVTRQCAARDFSVNQLPRFAVHALRGLFAIYARSGNRSVPVLIAVSIPGNAWVGVPRKSVVVIKGKDDAAQVIGAWYGVSNTSAHWFSISPIPQYGACL